MTISQNGVAEKIHTLAAADVFTALQTRPAGLTPLQAAARLQRMGPNVLREAKGKPLYLKFLANYHPSDGPAS